jgi:RNase H-like domain found in reverse transcriptase/Integrase zinc binding domain/Chromo (CHRromatin Organisation MOdifier) domain/Integrase core domain
MDPTKVQAITEWPEPRNVKDLRQFLGFVNFYRHFLPKLADLTHFLTPLTGKKGWVWTEIESDAFKKIKEAVTSDRILAIADNTLPYRVETDASDFAISAVLSQEKDGLRRPIAFISRSLTETERNYSTYDKEFYAIIFALESWRKYLLDVVSKTEVLSDHRNLSFFMKPQNLNRRQARWISTLQEYDVEIKHIAGKQNARADALSRRPDYEPTERDNTGVIGIPEDLISKERSPLGQENRAILVDESTVDPTLMTKIDAARGDTEPRIEDGKIFVPNSPELQGEIIRHHHDSVIAGHPGIDRTLEAIQRSFIWPRMRQTVAEYVQACQECQRVKIDRTARRAPLNPHDVPPRPWHTITIDMIGPLPSSNGFDAILVIVDRFSKRMILEPVTTKLTAQGVANIYVKRVFANWGLPEKVISDRGSTFVSKFMVELYAFLKIEKNASTAYHPITDGQTERMNQEIETYLRFYANHDQSNWSQYLPLAEFTYNDHRSSSTGFSPFYLTNGRHPTKGFELAEYSSDNDSATEFATRLKEVSEVAKDNLRHTQEVMKNSYNKHKKAANVYQKGDKVWLDAMNLTSTRPTKKLEEKRYGPFEVLEKVGFSSYRLGIPAAWKIHPVFNECLLRPVVEPRFTWQDVYDQPPPDIVDAEEVYEVQEILDTRVRKRGRYEYRQFLVSWKGYPSEDNTWQDEDDLEDAADVVADFKRRHPAWSRRIDAAGDVGYEEGTM